MVALIGVVVLVFCDSRACFVFVVAVVLTSTHGCILLIPRRHKTGRLFQMPYSSFFCLVFFPSHLLFSSLFLLPLTRNSDPGSMKPLLPPPNDGIYVPCFFFARLAHPFLLSYAC